MLPVAELHIHIEGTLEPELLVKLARRNGTWMPTLDADELRAQYRFDGLQSFLDLHYANLRVLKIEQDFYDLARAYLTRAAAAGVRRAEIFFDPQTHLANGVPLEEVFGGSDGRAGRRRPGPRDLRRPDPVLPARPGRGRRRRGSAGLSAVPGPVHRRRARLYRGRLPAFAVHRGVQAGGGRRAAAGGPCGRGGRPGLRARGARPARRGTRRPRGAVHGGSRRWSPGCATSRSP